METRSHLPNFTLSLRGYDRMEVDDYLGDLAEALGGVDAARAEADQMQAEIARLRARVAELERCIRTETPRTGPALAERIALILQEAEQAAAETVRRAETEAEEIRRAARLSGTEADKQASSAMAQADEQARRIEAEARSQASEIVADAEARAVVRTRQIEHWAEQVVSHTRAEEARMAAEKAAHRAGAEAQVAALVAKRESVAASLAKLRETLGEALGLIEPSDPVVIGPSAIEPLLSTSTDTDRPADAYIPGSFEDGFDHAATGHLGTGVEDRDAELEDEAGGVEHHPIVEAESPSEVDHQDEDDKPVTGKIIVIDGLDDPDLVAIAGGFEAVATTHTTKATADELAAVRMASERSVADAAHIDDTGEIEIEIALSPAEQDDERPWPAAFNPVDDPDDSMSDLDAKYDAWEASKAESTDGIARHFKHRF